MFPPGFGGPPPDYYVAREMYEQHRELKDQAEKAHKKSEILKLASTLVNAKDTFFGIELTDAKKLHLLTERFVQNDYQLPRPTLSGSY